MRRARITAAGVQVDITLRETATADAIWAALPISGSANTWGDEVYFATPVSCERESGAKDVMQPGEIAFWPDEDAIAIGHGPTPISSGDEIRLASPSNVWADADSDVRVFASVPAGSAITVEAL
jgi:hypothetical protein